MKNVSNEEDNRLLDNFFEEKIVPLAKAAEESGVEVLQLGLSKEADSYFIDRNDNGNYLHSIDSANTDTELAKLWANDPIPGLSEIASPLMELAEKLHENEEESGEVSPFVYAMF